MHTGALIGLFLYFAVLLLIVLREKRNTDAVDYFFAGRSLPFWALSITFVASWWGAGSALSTADLAYQDGLSAFIYYGVPVLIATFLMFFGAGAIRRVGYLTQGAMMTARYSKNVGRMLSVMILIFMTMNTASQMVGIGQFFGTYLGMSYETAIVLGTGFVVIYSMFGGFRAVVLTDIIQFVLLTLSALTVFGAAMYYAGGWSGIAAAAEAAGRVGFTDMTSGLSKYLMYVITFGCSWVIQANVWQRISATRDDRDARRMVGMSFVAYIPLYLIVVLTGMAGLVLFPTLPEGGIVTGVVSQFLPPVLGAVVFVGISAAIMSTMDSLINTAALTLTMDLGMGGKGKHQIAFSRLATLLVSVVALLIALRIRSILDVAWLASDVITTGVFVPLILGFVWKRGTARGAMLSMVGGLLYSLYNLAITFGLALPSFWTAQSAQQVILGVGLSLGLYVGGSLLSIPDGDRGGRFVRLAGGLFVPKVLVD